MGGSGIHFLLKFSHYSSVRALGGYFGPPMRSKNKSYPSQVSSN